MHFSRPGSREGRPWTVHFRGACHVVREVRCEVPMRSEWRPGRRSEPRAFFTATASSLEVTEDGVATLR